ncbi:MAG TPA: hypothetical protein VGP50_07210 [Stellaceae bacterium]|jgi:hypothetical protein|nr:hypothetical protein [Stellaceae bacterium]
MSGMLSTLRLCAFVASLAATAAALSACSSQNGDNTGTEYINALGGYHR